MPIAIEFGSICWLKIEAIEKMSWVRVGDNEMGCALSVNGDAGETRCVRELMGV